MEPLSVREELPVDERLVAPDQRMEILRGAVLMTPPADEPHGTSHTNLAYVIRAHVAATHVCAVDMLTRTSKDSDFAPDASIFPLARRPDGGRQLEEIAFEIVSEQWIGVPSEKARELAKRGVRRVFCVVLKKQRVLEWSRETDGWQVLHEGSVIEDRCLAQSLPMKALLSAADADRAVVEALHARGALREIEAASRDEGIMTARRQAARDLCEVLEIPLDDARAAQLDGLDPQGLAALLAEIKRARRWPSR